MDIEDIWKKYRVALKAFLHSRVSNPDDVDDLLQEVLIKTYKNIDTIKSEDSLKSWLFQITNRTIIDFYRKEGRLDNVNLADLILDEEAPDVLQALSECIRPFINSLPNDSSTLLASIVIDGKSQKEVAKELGISYSTLKSRVQKSRLQLRKQFEACCHISLNSHARIIDFEPKSQDC